MYITKEQTKSKSNSSTYMHVITRIKLYYIWNPFIVQKSQYRILLLASLLGWSLCATAAMHVYLKAFTALRILQVLMAIFRPPQVSVCWGSEVPGGQSGYLSS